MGPTFFIALAPSWALETLENDSLKLVYPLAGNLYSPGLLI